MSNSAGILFNRKIKGNVLFFKNIISFFFFYGTPGHENQILSKSWMLFDILETKD